MIRTLMSFAKARFLSRILGRALGGPVGTALMVAYLGRKAYKMMNKRRARLA